MSTKIGHFEILSELTKSPTGVVYKANDPESGQTIALKAIQLSSYGESAVQLEKALLAEAENAKVLSSPNITNVYGAGEVDGQFCAAMEYVQGNSIATMLARKEGFSIWDLLDIGRQLCAALDYAGSNNIVHYSLEPSKIMCGWDGTVKILSYGISSVGNFAQQVTEGLPSILHYMPPEQVYGQPMDGRSNLFSLGAMFYEMVTEQKAFNGDGIEAVRQAILDSSPAVPKQLNPKIHPLLSDLILKALSKDPAARYQSGRELLDDLEKCKESKPSAAKKATPATSNAAPVAANVKAAVQSKSVSAATPKAAPKPAAPPAVKTAASAPAPAVSAMAKAASAAAGSATVAETSSEIAELDLSNQFIGASVKATLTPAAQPSARMSSAVVDEPQVETFEPESAPPRIAVDPMMAEDSRENVSKSASFSEMTELPPLKEVYVAPPPPRPVDVPLVVEAKPAATVFSGSMRREEETPKVNPREVAEKAIKEITGVPRKLMLYAVGGACALILAIGIGVTFYVHQQNDDDSGSGRTAAQVAPTAEVSQPATTPAPAPAAEPQEIPEKAQRVERAAAPAHARAAHKKASAPAAPAIVPGQLAIDSTPSGAQVQIDGRTDPSWVTPFVLSSLDPGAHTLVTSKAGYSSDTRTVQVNSGNRASASIRLAQMVARLVVNSSPAGANVYVDGRDVGAKTPAQVNVNSGQHVVLVRKIGYLDETMNAQFVLGQTFNFSPALRPLGNVDDIRTVGGRFSKLIGGKSALPGQAVVTIHTQPKGAQVAINEHIMDKNSPLEAALDPGNYVVDITMTGYAPVHKVITVDRGAKILIDENLQPQ